MADDERILEMFLERDERAIEEVARHYGKYCHRVADNILLNETDAQDCVTDTYMRLWNSIPPDAPKNFLAYLARVTRNLALDMYRRLHAKRRFSTAEVVLEELEELIADPSSTADDLDRAQLADALNAFLDTLSDMTRKVFVRRYFYVSSVRAIAADYQLSEPSVKVSLHRTRQKLKAFLQQKGITL